MELPLTTAEVFQLNAVSGGLKPGTISYKTLTLESDKYVCLRDVQEDGQASLVIVDLEKRESMRNNIRDAESAIMNPKSKILALRSGRNLQVYDVDASKRLKATLFTDDVVYWRWVDDRTIGLVTSTAVYHWSLNTAEDAQPERMFDRLPDMDASVQILSYRVDEKHLWFMLCGVARGQEGMVGKTQLYSVENRVGRTVDGHAGTFITTSTPTESRLCNIMCLAWNNPPQGGKVQVMELPTGSKKDITLQRRVEDVPFPASDFPVAMNVSPRHLLLTIMTSRGNVVLMDIFTGVIISIQQVTPTVVFCGAPHSQTGGLLCVNAQGSVFHVSPNDNGIVPYVKNQMRNPELALRIAGSANLGGVDDLYRVQLENSLRMGDITGAVSACLRAPNNALRVPEVLARFVHLPPVSGQPPAISTYFKMALAESTLNVHESIELARAVVPKGGAAYIKQQYEANKLTVSEELGDLLAQAEPDVALKIYHKADAHAKVVNIFLQRSETQKAVEYCKRANFSPDWRVILNNFIRINPQNAVSLALMLHRDMGTTPILDPNEVIDMFVTAQQIQQATEFIIEILNGNCNESTRGLQTKLLEINLKHSHPSVAEKIFSRGLCTHFDGMLLAPLCERAGLSQRAIECYVMAQNQSPDVDNLPNIRRCLSHAQSFNPEWLVEFFGKLTQSDSVKCLEDLLQNYRQNFKVIVQVATKYSDALGAENLIDIFLERKLYDILYYYLGAIVPYTRDPEVHFRYIEAAAEVGQTQELERMTRESPCYDPERTKNYLKGKKLTDQWPVINVCDQHNYVDELVRYLMDTENEALVEQYVQRRSPGKTPQVVAALIDSNVREEFIKNILNAVGTMCPITELVEVVEERGRMRLIQGWLEARLAEKKTDPALHTALGKLYVDSDNGAEKFLVENAYYDPLLLGKYCENRNPNLSYIAYRKGHLSQELVDLTRRNGMWKQLARYLVQEKNLELWASVLKDDSRDRERLVEAVQQSALPESEVTEEVSTTVRAFMSAEMTAELTSILEQIVLRGRFRKNRFLENLLIISAIRARQDKVMEYVSALENYDASEIAQAASNAGLHEVALTVYDKHGMKKEAAIVLMRDLKDSSRGRLYAEKCDTPAVWSVLGEYLLQADELHEAIDALIRAKNPDYVEAVTAAAERNNQFGDLIKYLNMARTESRSKDNRVDTALVITFAKTGRLAELEEFLKETHSVQIQPVADKCFEDGLYDSARVLYTLTSNFPKLALTFIKMDNFPGAVEAAQKAQSRPTWEAVNIACIEANEIKLANMCAVPLVLHAELLQGVVDRYESHGLWEELMSVLKTASGTSGAHMGIFTGIGLLLAKYRPENLLDHVNMNAKKINTHKMIAACEQYHHWLVLRVLHVNNEDWLAAATTMIQHYADAWDHEIFKDVVSHLGASDIVYTSISFYIKTSPHLLNDLLSSVSKTLDPERVLLEVEKLLPVHFIRHYLESVQGRNIRRVNEALNRVYTDEEDFAALRNSVEHFDNFDSAELSLQLEKMELFEFRKIALFLHRRNKRFKHAIEVAKTNKLYQDAIETAVESANSELVEELLDFFVVDHPECFVSCLYTCYDHLAPQVVLEKAWLNKRTDLAMPYLIQVVQDYTAKVLRIERSMADAQQSAREAARRVAPLHPPGGDPLMIQAGPAAHAYNTQPMAFGNGRPA